MDKWISAIDGSRIGNAHGQTARPESAVLVNEIRYAQQLQLGTWPSTFNKFVSTLEQALAVPVPRTTGFSAQQGGGALLAMAPGRWIYLAREQAQARAFPDLRAEVGVATDVSHTFSCLRIAGPMSADVLAKGAAIDFRRAFPAGAVTRTVIHAMGVTIWHSSTGVYELFVYTSFAQSLFDWIVDASQEFGCKVGELLLGD